MPAESPEVRRRPFGVLVLAIVAAFLIWGVLVVFPTLRTVLFLAFLASVLATILKYPIDFLGRWMPRALATTLALILLLALGAGVGWLVVPSTLQQAEKFVNEAPRLLDQLATWWNDVSSYGILQRLRDANLFDQLQRWATQEAARMLSAVVPLVEKVVGAGGGVVLVLVLALFFANSPEAYLAVLLRLVPKDHEEITARVTGEIAAALRSWSLGTLVAMTTVGILTAVAMLIVGVKTWLLVGVVGFFGEFVPYIGPFVTLLVAVAAGFAQAPMVAVWAGVAHIVVQELEGHAVQPLIMRRAVRLPPGILLLWQLAFTAAFGLLGLLISTPLLGAVRAAVDSLWSQRMLGKPPPSE